MFSLGIYSVRFVSPSSSTIEFAHAHDPLDSRVIKCYLMIMTKDELRQRRKRLDMTQKELARKLDVTPMTIKRWEGGKVEIPRTIELALKEIERQESK